VARSLATPLVSKLNLYKLRSRLVIEDLSEILGVLAVWDGEAKTAYGLAYADPRLQALGVRVMVAPHLAAAAAADLGAKLVDAAEYEAHRIALGVPSGGVDFRYGDAFPHEADMDQLHGVDFAKGCYVGQEVVSRMEHRGSARTRAVPLRYDGVAPAAGSMVTAGERQLGTMGSATAGHGLALLRLDRVAEALSNDQPLLAGGVPIRLVKPDWARFAFPGEPKAAE
jgi:tRNA-modifying protein YgfZ